MNKHPKHLAKLKAFSALVAQGAALIWNQKMKEGQLDANFSPVEGFWKAWSDGSHLPEKNMAGLGGVLVNEDGLSIAAFSTSRDTLGDKKGSLQAEFMALKETLDLALAAGAKKLEVRLDCQPLVRVTADILMSKEQASEEHQALKDALLCFESVALKWTPREANKLADALSKRPFNLGRFYGGESQQDDWNEIWHKPEKGFREDHHLNLNDMAFHRAQNKMEKLMKRHGLNEVVSNGLVRMALGGKKMEDEQEQESYYVAAASMASSSMKKNAQIEPSEGWSIGKSQKSLKSALMQALADKTAKLGRSDIDCKKMEMFISKQVVDELTQEKTLDSFIEDAYRMIKSMHHEVDLSIEITEESRTLADKKARHLLNEWELRRALSMKDLFRNEKEEIKSKKPKA